MRHSLLVRIIGCAAAVVVCAWFALGIRQAHDTDAATVIVSGAGPIGAAQARHAQSLLHDAGQLNPDRAVDLLRSQLELRRGNLPAARAIALRVTRAEPQNIDAWLAYGSASSNDRSSFRLALSHLEELAPTVHTGS